MYKQITMKIDFDAASCVHVEPHVAQGSVVLSTVVSLTCIIRYVKTSSSCTDDYIILVLYRRDQ